ncbi:MAG: hypothetical protein H6Q91_1786, partial [Deltaproteobacteria bacterium]|nr:hypothetical protein [Deltaproteobacteria bacterium]
MRTRSPISRFQFSLVAFALAGALLSG